jgi:hypothetical protein
MALVLDPWGAGSTTSSDYANNNLVHSTTTQTKMKATKWNMHGILSNVIRVPLVAATYMHQFNRKYSRFGLFNIAASTKHVDFRKSSPPFQYTITN